LTDTTTPTQLTGYSTDVQLLASRYTQGGRTIYSLDLTPAEIASLITTPDPDVLTPGNRAIRKTHADDFAKYLRKRKDWVSPSLMIRAPKKFDFQVVTEMESLQHGILSIKRQELGDLFIVDGQHRILGINLALKSIDDDLDKARSNLARARQLYGAGGREEADARQVISNLEAERERLSKERINLQIVVVSDPVAYKQLFFDIADNALGITASVRTRFDSTKVVNRAMPLVLDHPLLQGKVDIERDRTSGSSPYIMSAKHVNEVIRSVTVGIDGRVSKIQETTLNEATLAKNTKTFFTMLARAFPQMQAIEYGQITAETLRKTSLLGSVLFVRILAGVYWDLTMNHAFSEEMVEEFFDKIAPHTSAPVYSGDIWTTRMPEHFSPGMSAPRGARQNTKGVTVTLVDWAITKPDFLDEAPAERPPVEEPWVDPEYGVGYSEFGADVPVAS
jgi:hypothetical protein